MITAYELKLEAIKMKKKKQEQLFTSDSVNVSEYLMR